MGYSIPNTVADDDVEQDIATAREKYDAKVIKIHPNVTGLDLGGSAGKERVEKILSAGGSHGMPVVIHGGRSPVLQDVTCREYAHIDNLMTVDFSVTQSPVIIAHGATFGCSDEECEEAVIPSLKRLLEENNNLFVNTAGVSLRALELMFSHVDLERIVFGSDALYLSQRESLMKVCSVMEKLNMDVSDGLLEIASVTPAALL
jgi:predicted TIM-barrel fold metal-dependent hydrolase